MIYPADLRLDRSDKRMIVRLSGEIDLSNAGQVKRTIAESISNHVMELVIDLGEVQYLDSAGIAMLFDLARGLGEHEQCLTVVVPSTSLIRRSLQASGWPLKFPMVESLDELAE
ncbi:MAG TPA: STAS domain-containing protein [Actinomycetota bacterium]|nr:STAS domain-containing protein [Actinomycetota bacterium]